MAIIELVSASIPSSPLPTGDRVDLIFDQTLVDNAALYTKENYVFRTRYGNTIKIYAKEVLKLTTTKVSVILQDAALINASYEAIVFNIEGTTTAGAIQDGAQNTATFAATFGDPFKTFQLKKKVPEWYNTVFGTLFHALLGATGDLYDTVAGTKITSAASEVARAIQLRTAAGVDLSTIGQNYGISRLSFAINDDDLWRQLIPIFGTEKKAVLNIFHEALTVALGTASANGWGVFEIRPNELEVDIPVDVFFGLAPGTLASATYLHDSDSGTSTSVGLNFLTDTTKTWTVNQFDGLFLYDSASTRFEVISNTSDTLTIVGTPASGAYAILDEAPPSYLGDYFLADATVAGSTIDDNIIVLFQHTVVTDLLEPLKAAGIQININTIGE